MRSYDKSVKTIFTYLSRTKNLDALLERHLMPTEVDIFMKQYGTRWNEEKAKRNRKTGRALIAVTPTKVDVDAKAKKTTTKTSSKPANEVQVAFSFDDTGSMGACRRVARNVIDKLSTNLLVSNHQSSVATIVHGDYCDGPKPVDMLDFTTDLVSIKRFLEKQRNYCGGDAPECYEFVLNMAQSLKWNNNANKTLVIIGDDVPHRKDDYAYSHGAVKYKWDDEIKFLRDMGVRIIAVQALNNSYANRFYETMAETTNGHYLRLPQLSQTDELMQLIMSHASGNLPNYIKSVNLSPSMKRNADVLSGLKKTATVDSMNELSDYQMFTVEHKLPIKAFVESMGLDFRTGCGFYEFMKPETVQDYKQVIVQDRKTERFYPDAKGRQLLNLPSTGSVRINPKNYSSRYRFFIQSTSVNRVLVPDTSFLYKMT